MVLLHSLIAAAFLAPAAPAEPPADPIDAAAKAVTPLGIEDDGSHDEFFVSRFTTTGCVTVVRGTGAQEIVIDWKKAAVAAMSEGFIYVRAEPISLAILADVDRRDQYDKLVALSAAIGKRAKECAGPPVVTDADRPKR